MTFVETCVVNQCRARHTTTPVAQTQLTQHSTHSTAHTLQSELEKKKEKKGKKGKKNEEKHAQIKTIRESSSQAYSNYLLFTRASVDAAVVGVGVVDVQVFSPCCSCLSKPIRRLSEERCRAFQLLERRRRREKMKEIHSRPTQLTVEGFIQAELPASRAHALRSSILFELVDGSILRESSCASHLAPSCDRLRLISRPVHSTG